MTTLLLLSFAISLAVIALARRGTLGARLADHPNERSLHTNPTPRVGGLGVMAGALVVVAVSGTGDARVLAACALALSALSLVDDARGLPALTRLAAHLAAAVGGTPLQIRTSLARLIERGLVNWTGQARGTRYTAV